MFNLSVFLVCIYLCLLTSDNLFRFCFQLLHFRLGRPKGLPVYYCCGILLVTDFLVSLFVIYSILLDFKLVSFMLTLAIVSQIAVRTSVVNCSAF